MKTAPLPQLYAARLIALDQVVNPHEYFLDDDMCTIGRSASCHVVIQGRIAVSRLHARIERHGIPYLLYDNDSANGTFVNRVRIDAPHQLNDHDQIGLSHMTPILMFEVSAKTTKPLERSHLVYDEEHRIFLLNHQPLALAPAQFRLLLHLYRHHGELCTIDSCAVAMWGTTARPSHYPMIIQRHMTGILQRMLVISSDTDVIQTLPGVGYRLMS